MDLNSFPIRNSARCLAATGFNHKPNDWSLNDWMVALAGEVGEACNVAKKLRRIECGFEEEHLQVEYMEHLKEELADAYIYLDLIFSYLDLDKAKIVEDKFNKKSEEIGYEDPYKQR